ncbi:hypothetical protein KJ664_02830 [Patescibacteria group bacterium]|nr:hypothetical protein [Patescibacteria group bacterium]
MNKLNMILGGLIVIALVGGFFGGTLYQKKQSSNRGQFNNLQRGQIPGGSQNAGVRQGNVAGFSGAGMARPISGEVVALDDKSMTVKLIGGSTKIVILSDTTKYTKSQDVAKTDLTVGGTVAVIVAPSQDQAVVAETVELNPILRGQNK